jgi:hypothetical protein
MSVEFSKSGKPRYIQKVRIKGKVVSKYLGVGDAGRIAHEALVATRQQFNLHREIDLDLEIHYERLEQVINQILAQHLSRLGYIQRQCLWKNIDRLQCPLSSVEQLRIENNLAVAVPCEYVQPVPRGIPIDECYKTKILIDLIAT